MSGITIKDIAKKSGYSVSTVSRVLNNQRDVSKKARKEVLSVVEKYNFVPNTTARFLKQHVSNSISIIVKGSSNMLFASIIETLQSRIEEENYVAAVFYLDEDENEVEYALRIWREQKPSAFIFLGGNNAYFEQSFHHIKVPSILVTTSASNLNMKHLSSVYTDDVAGAFKAVEHLLEQGHRTIGIIGGNLERSNISQLRYLGCVQAFTKYQIPFEPDRQYETSRFSLKDAYEATHRLLEKLPELTAIFTMSDVMAIGSIRALADRNIRVPDDCSVIGYDGIELGKYYNPKITTITQQYELLALRTVIILTNQIRNKTASIHEVTPFVLTVGESVRKVM